jgi:hypothetical protein
MTEGAPVDLPAEAVGPPTGALLFARYAYPPNALGYCGPDDPEALVRAAAAPEGSEALRALVDRFDGASAYLALIAASNGVADPLDRAVVEAYWVGNDLLRQVPPGALRRCGPGPLAGPSGTRGAGDDATRRGVAHHSFHVFAVYPWLALLRSGKEQPALEVLDRCRIRWGRVEAVAGDAVTVRSRGLVSDRGDLLLGPGRDERARLPPGSLESARPVRPGDLVTLHWDWVCDLLSASGLFWLHASTLRNLDAVNGAGPDADPAQSGWVDSPGWRGERRRRNAYSRADLPVEITPGAVTGEASPTC